MPNIKPLLNEEEAYRKRKTDTVYKKAQSLSKQGFFEADQDRKLAEEAKARAAQPASATPPPNPLEGMDYRAANALVAKTNALASSKQPRGQTPTWQQITASPGQVAPNPNAVPTRGPEQQTAGGNLWLTNELKRINPAIIQSAEDMRKFRMMPANQKRDYIQNEMIKRQASGLQDAVNKSATMEDLDARVNRLMNPSGMEQDSFGYDQTINSPEFIAYRRQGERELGKEFAEGISGRDRSGWSDPRELAEFIESLPSAQKYGDSLAAYKFSLMRKYSSPEMRLKMQAEDLNRSNFVSGYERLSKDQINQMRMEAIDQAIAAGAPTPNLVNVGSKELGNAIFSAAQGGDMIAQGIMDRMINEGYIPPKKTVIDGRIMDDPFSAQQAQNAAAERQRAQAAQDEQAGYDLGVQRKRAEKQWETEFEANRPKSAEEQMAESTKNRYALNMMNAVLGVIAKIEAGEDVDTWAIGEKAKDPNSLAQDLVAQARMYMGTPNGKQELMANRATIEGNLAAMAKKAGWAGPSEGQPPTPTQAPATQPSQVVLREPIPQGKVPVIIKGTNDITLAGPNELAALRSGGVEYSLAPITDIENPEAVIPDYAKRMAAVKDADNSIPDADIRDALVSDFLKELDASFQRAERTRLESAAAKSKKSREAENAVRKARAKQSGAFGEIKELKGRANLGLYG